MTVSFGNPVRPPKSIVSRRGDVTVSFGNPVRPPKSIVSRRGGVTISFENPVPTRSNLDLTPESTADKY